MNKLTILSVRFGPVTSILFFLLLSLTFTWAVPDAEGATKRLYIVGNTPNAVVTGSAGTTNLPIGSSSDLAGANNDYVTTLSLSNYGSGDTATNMRESYTPRRPAAPYYLLGTAYLNSGFSTDAIISPNTIGSFNANSTNTNSGDRVRFRLIDYDPTGVATTVVIATSTSDPAVRSSTTTALSVTFDNSAAYTLPAGHYLGVETRYYPNSDTSGRYTGRLYCNYNKPSYVDVDIRFPITASSSINGQISASGTITATSTNSPVTTQIDYDSNKDYTVTADTGYAIQSLTVDGLSIAAAVGQTSYTYSFNNINRAHTISATFLVTSVTFNVAPGSGGGIDLGPPYIPIPPYRWPGGTTYSYTDVAGIYPFLVIPDAGYGIDWVRTTDKFGNVVDVGVPQGQTTTYSLNVDIANINTLSANFLPFYTVTSSAGVGGTISPSGATSVLSGQAITFDVTPDAGFRILSITVDGDDKGNTSPYTITNVTGNHTVVASFLPTYTITATAGPNGTISPIGDVVVDSGTSRNFSITANSGFRVSDVLIDGTSVGPMTNYTFVNVTANHTIEVSFVASPPASAYCAIPPFISTPAPASVMLMLSVESPMEGAANPTVSCTGGTPSSFTYNCNSSGLGAYDNTKNYYGYFENNKCYTYSGSGATGLFTPSGAATNHQCSAGTAWSGNMLNWSTMLAVDAFRKAFTGGNRTVDTATDTVLLGAVNDGSWFPANPTISNAELYMPVTGTNVTRTIMRRGGGVGFGVCNAGITNCTVGRTGSGEAQWPTIGTNTAAVYSLRIKACDSTGGVETRCNSTTNKPEGTIQKYMDRMRFALMSYTSDGNQNRDGGVLREKMKWISPTIPNGLKYHDASNNVVTCTTSTGCVNPEKEVNTDGTFVNNPDGASSGNSGVINYINKFAYTSGYKGYDPAGEMYYEVIRYFKNLVPSVNNYCSGITEPNDGFAVYCNSSKTNARGWRDPALYSCSQNFVVAINDANPWLDKRIPGSAFDASYGGSAAGGTDYCGSSVGACDSDFTDGAVQVNVENWTKLVGDYEGFTGRTFSTAGKMYGCEVNASGVCIGGFNSSGKSITVSNLGRIIGTPPGPGKENSYNMAGLAYYAHNTDLRTDLNGTQNMTTFMIDTQEPNNNMLVGPMNMLWLAAKYGGFDDRDKDGKPYNGITCGGASSTPNTLCFEWDADNEGTPDNYFFANEGSKVETGLNYAFSKIVNTVSSGTAAAVANNKSGERGANMIQALFYPQFPTDRNIKWLGEVQALWYYLDPVISYSTIREDTDSDFELDLTKDQVPGADPFATKALWKAGVNLHTRTASSRSIYSLLSSDTNLTSSGNAFTTSQRSTLKPLLDISALTDPQADSLINYLRGVDSGTYRSRTVTHSGNTAVWKLGDVINSTPQVQSTVPLNAYHQIYGDISYKSYIGSDEYKSKELVYGGANDGMLHAFKLGLVQKITDATKPFRIAGIVDDTDIGKEQWAYIPQNVLPYMKNTADQGYCHQYLVDGAPLLVDASINRHSECTASNYWECARQTKFAGTLNSLDAAKTSWKSVLIGSMGLGGASRDGNCNETLNPDSDPANNEDCVKSPVAGSGLSSYFALDVSDPLVPKHLWEFSDAVLPAADKGLGFTTSGSAIIRINAQSGSPLVADKSKNGRWFAVFASGPTGRIDTATRQFLGRSDQNLKIYVVDINAFDTSSSFVNGTNYWVFDTGKKFAFANSLSGATIDLDRYNSTLGGYYSDDVLYVSYTKASLDSSPSPGPYPTVWDKGGVLRLVTNNDPNPANWFISTLIDDIGPVTTSIGKLQDRNNKKLWIYFGEGRYFFTGDELSPTRRIFGVADPCYNYDIAHENTLSTTAANCPALSLSSLKDQSNTPNDVLGVTDKGWWINLEASTGGTGAERVVSDVTASFNGIVFYTTFIPSNDICVAGGNTSLWAVKYSTGGTPPSGGLKGKAPLQTSSGGITMVDLETSFTERGGRKLSSGLSPTGMAPKGRFPQLLQPRPVKTILNIQER